MRAGRLTRSPGVGPRREEPAGRSRLRDPGGGGAAPTFPAPGPGVPGAEPPEHCLPPSSSLHPRPAARHTILAGSGSRAAAMEDRRPGPSRGACGRAAAAESRRRGPRAAGTRREGTRRGRWLRCWRPGDRSGPRETEGRACAWGRRRDPWPAARRGGRSCPVGEPGRGSSRSSVGAENRRGLGGYGFVGSEPHFSGLWVNSGGGLVCKAAVYYVADLRAYAGRWHVISDWLRFKHF